MHKTRLDFSSSSSLKYISVSVIRFVVVSNYDRNGDILLFVVARQKAMCQASRRETSNVRTEQSTKITWALGRCRCVFFRRESRNGVKHLNRRQVNSRRPMPGCWMRYT